MTEVILLEKIPKLGSIGDKVKVKGGYARNFLLPKGKALRATADNIKVFEDRRIAFEAENTKKINEANSIAEKISGMELSITMQADGEGHLYGSVSHKDVVKAIQDLSGDDNILLSEKDIIIRSKIKSIGEYQIDVSLYGGMLVNVKLNVIQNVA